MSEALRGVVGELWTAANANDDHVTLDSVDVAIDALGKKVQWLRKGLSATYT